MLLLLRGVFLVLVHQHLDGHPALLLVGALLGGDGAEADRLETLLRLVENAPRKLREALDAAD